MLSNQNLADLRTLITASNATTIKIRVYDSPEDYSWVRMSGDQIIQFLNDNGYPVSGIENSDIATIGKIPKRQSSEMNCLDGYEGKNDTRFSPSYYYETDYEFPLTGIQPSIFLLDVFNKSNGFFFQDSVNGSGVNPVLPPTNLQNIGILLVQRVIDGWTFNMQVCGNYQTFEFESGSASLVTRSGISYVYVESETLDFCNQRTASGNFNSWDTGIIPVNTLFTCRYESDGIYISFFNTSTGSFVDPLTIPNGTLLEIQLSGFINNS